MGTEPGVRKSTGEARLWLPERELRGHSVGSQSNACAVLTAPAAAFRTSCPKSVSSQAGQCCLSQLRSGAQRSSWHIVDASKHC